MGNANALENVIENFGKTIGEADAASVITQAEMFAWIFARLVEKDLATANEVKSFLKGLQDNAKHDLQKETYGLVLNRLFGIEKPE